MGNLATKLKRKPRQVGLADETGAATTGTHPPKDPIQVVDHNDIKISVPDDRKGRAESLHSSEVGGQIVSTGSATSKGCRPPATETHNRLHQNVSQSDTPVPERWAWKRKTGGGVDSLLDYRIGTYSILCRLGERKRDASHDVVLIPHPTARTKWMDAPAPNPILPRKSPHKRQRKKKKELKVDLNPIEKLNILQHSLQPHSRHERVWKTRTDRTSDCDISLKAEPKEKTGNATGGAESPSVPTETGQVPASLKDLVETLMAKNEYLHDMLRSGTPNEYEVVSAREIERPLENVQCDHLDMEQQPKSGDSMDDQEHAGRSEGLETARHTNDRILEDIADEVALRIQKIITEECQRTVEAIRAEEEEEEFRPVRIYLTLDDTGVEVEQAETEIDFALSTLWNHTGGGRGPEVEKMDREIATNAPSRTDECLDDLICLKPEEQKVSVTVEGSGMKSPMIERQDIRTHVMEQPTRPTDVVVCDCKVANDILKQTVSNGEDNGVSARHETEDGQKHGFSGKTERQSETLQQKFDETCGRLDESIVSPDTAQCPIHLEETPTKSYSDGKLEPEKELIGVKSGNRGRQRRQSVYKRLEDFDSVVDVMIKREVDCALAGDEKRSRSRSPCNKRKKSDVTTGARGKKDTDKFDWLVTATGGAKCKMKTGATVGNKVVGKTSPKDKKNKAKIGASVKKNTVVTVGEVRDRRTGPKRRADDVVTGSEDKTEIRRTCVVKEGETKDKADVGNEETASKVMTETVTSDTKGKMENIRSVTNCESNAGSEGKTDAVTSGRVELEDESTKVCADNKTDGSKGVVDCRTAVSAGRTNEIGTNDKEDPEGRTDNARDETKGTFGLKNNTSESKIMRATVTTGFMVKRVSVGTGSKGKKDIVENGKGLTDTVASGKGMADTVASGKGMTDTVAGDKGMADTVASGKGMGTVDTVASGKGMKDTVASGKGMANTVASGKGMADTVASGFMVKRVNVVTGSKGKKDIVANDKGMTDTVTTSSKGMPDAVNTGLKGIADTATTGPKGMTDVTAGSKGMTNAVTTCSKNITGDVTARSKGMKDTSTVASGTDDATTGSKGTRDAVTTGSKGMTDAVTAGFKGMADTVTISSKGVTDAVTVGSKGRKDTVASGIEVTAGSKDTRNTVACGGTTGKTGVSKRKTAKIDSVASGPKGHSTVTIGTGIQIMKGDVTTGSGESGSAEKDEGTRNTGPREKDLGVSMKKGTTLAKQGVKYETPAVPKVVISKVPSPVPSENRGACFLKRAFERDLMRKPVNKTRRKVPGKEKQDDGKEAEQTTEMFSGDGNGRTGHEKKGTVSSGVEGRNRTGVRTKAELNDLNKPNARMPGMKKTDEHEMMNILNEERAGLTKTSTTEKGSHHHPDARLTSAVQPEGKRRQIRQAQQTARPRAVKLVYQRRGKGAILKPRSTNLGDYLHGVGGQGATSYHDMRRSDRGPGGAEGRRYFKY